ncbi:AlpA family transcriptional regulator [Moraxellaceae bacterium AER2_44_116]|nr:AlpA family transcriptional regulator [Moraxellaceae bacterium]TQC97178.1 AlpA family transcriptional regulator [Moraxellaceae bacterium AER2_44_116]
MKNPIQPPASPRIIRLSEVVTRVGLCRASIYNLIKAGDFPSQIKLGLNSVGWVESEVQTWINSRVQSSRPNQLSQVA